MSKKRFFISALIITLLSFAGIPALAASNLKESVGQLAQQISKSMEDKQGRRGQLSFFPTVKLYKWPIA